jgi:hypothetical protein
MKRIIILLLTLSIFGFAEEPSMMDNLRSKILTSAVSLYFHSRGYGKVENAAVDTTKKTLRFVLLPEGETQKLTIVIGHYHTEMVNKEDTLVLQQVQTNRVWLNRIFADHMEEGIKVPLGIASKSAGALLLNL